MLCSVDTLGTGSFAAETPNRKPPNEFGFTAWSRIQSPMRTAARA